MDVIKNKGIQISKHTYILDPDGKHIKLQPCSVAKLHLYQNNIVYIFYGHGNNTFLNKALDNGSS